MLWAFAFAVLLLALLIPILVVLFDAPALRRRVKRREIGSERDEYTEMLTRRIAILEDELDDLARAVTELRDEVVTMQRGLESRDASDAARRLAPPDR
jgi:hypothetical protein